MIADIFGKREMGKTTLARYLARQARLEIDLDPRSTFPITADATLLTYAADTPTVGETLEDYAIHQTPLRRIVIRPSGDLQLAVDALAADLEDLLRDDPSLVLAVVLDEAATYDLRAWNRLFRTANRARVWFILTCHRPVDLPPWVRMLTDWFIAFRITEPRDLQTLSERCGPEFVARVTKLPARHFLLWDDTTIDEGQQLRAGPAPEIWRMDLDRPSIVASDLPLETDAIATERPADLSLFR